MWGWSPVSELQKWGESREDFRLNESHELFKQDVEILVRSHRLLFQRYVNGEIVTHLHLGFGTRGSVCTVERALSSGGLVPAGRKFRGILDAPAKKAPVVVCHASDDVQGPVFVETVEFVDDPERVAKRIWSAKWLQPADLCDRVAVVDALYLPQATTAGGVSLLGSLEVLGRVLKNRKLGVVRSVSRSTRQFPHNMVEGRSEVMDTVARDGTPPRSRCLGPLDIMDLCGSVVLGDDVKGIRLSLGKATKLGLEAVAVFFCSVNLDPYLV
jgi:hypothetical protein